MSTTQGAFEQSLAHLLPQGAAWPRDPRSVWMRVIVGLAALFDELHRATLQATDEWLPHGTRTRLAEWEAATGLPDPCFGVLATQAERRAALLARLRGYQGTYDDSSPAAPGVIAAYCAQLGYPATVVYHVPFRVGRDRVGQRLGRLDGALYVTISGTTTDADKLRCALERVVPARYALNIVLS